MLLISEIYSRFLDKTSQLVYDFLKSEKEYLYFEKSMLESDSIILKKCFSAKCERFPKINQSFCCIEKYDIPGIQFRRSVSVMKKIFDLMNLSTKSIEIIINEELESLSSKSDIITKLLYCFLIDMLHKGLIYAKEREIRNFEFKEINYGKEIFTRNNDMDAMQFFLRTLIWRYIKKNLPSEIEFWKLQQSPLSLICPPYVAANTKIVLVVMKDKRGVFNTWMPLNFVERFFNFKDSEAYFITNEGYFFTDCTKIFTMDSEANSKIKLIKNVGINNSNISPNIKTLTGKIMLTKKERNRLIKQTAYMLKVCEIYDDVIKNVKRFPVSYYGKLIPIEEIEKYLKEVLFHLPYKKNKISFSKKNEIVRRYFILLINFIKDNINIRSKV